ncbi:hypothetical protein COU77_02655 [Candidatus Peregrinibacteria bacterium CG10_big_fil_rev_8_21_14_0_10_49_16]|nr:MAG: hypothetical protein COW95_02165 [Candidatus Peregrinibacteria bacterium CG22_combo_CG10-13_8_21_14_all_49_11]PIR51941.1 MAG: hypothetical protein COU77_02655 [Candidatus Peregrinibacteria bacterium CG10_big_fil_rev_8_21_14_0_10_49_16]
MPIEAVKIPQNVYIEDRIIGPITLKQLILSVIGSGISYLLWTGFSKAYGDQGVSIPLIIISIIPAVIFMAFAFVKVNDLSLMRITLLSFERVVKPSIRIWTPRAGVPLSFTSITHVSKNTQQEKDIQKKGKLSAEELSSILDTPTIQDTPLPTQNRINTPPTKTS